MLEVNKPYPPGCKAAICEVHGDTVLSPNRSTIRQQNPSWNRLYTVTNAPTISALDGDSTQIGMSIEGGLVQGSCDQVFFDTTSGTYTGYSIALGVSAPPLIPLPVVYSGHVTISSTKTFVSNRQENVNAQSAARLTNSSYSYIRRGCMGPILPATMRLS